MGEAKRMKDRIAQETAQSQREKNMHLRAQRAEGDLLKAQAELAAEKALADELEKVAHGVSWDHPARAAYRKARGL